MTFLSIHALGRTRSRFGPCGVCGKHSSGQEALFVQFGLMGAAHRFHEALSRAGYGALREDSPHSYALYIYECAEHHHRVEALRTVLLRAARRPDRDLGALRRIDVALLDRVLPITRDGDVGEVARLLDAYEAEQALLRGG